MKKTLFKTHFKPFSQNLKDLPLLSVILSDVHIGVTLQHMGAYRELSMLKESEKLTPEAVANHWAETTQGLEDRVIKGKAIRWGVDVQWVKQRMQDMQDNPVVKQYKERQKVIEDAVYNKIDLSGVKVIDENVPESMNMEVFLET